MTADEADRYPWQRAERRRIKHGQVKTELESVGKLTGTRNRNKDRVLQGVPGGVRRVVEAETGEARGWAGRQRAQIT